MKADIIVKEIIVRITIRNILLALLIIGIIVILSNPDLLPTKQNQIKKEAEKEKVRTRQDGKCAKCQKPPPARWEYYHIDGDRTNNSLDNCEGLCPNCYSIKTD